LQIDDSFVMTVNRRAERVRGSETICRMTWSEIDGYLGGPWLALALTQDCDGLEHYTDAAQQADKLQADSAGKNFFLV